MQGGTKAPLGAVVGCILGFMCAMVSSSIVIAYSSFDLSSDTSCIIEVYMDIKYEYI